MRKSVLDHLDIISKYTGTDIFLLGPKPADPEAADSSFNGSPDTGLDRRLRANIYGDMESAEHAKVRVLIMIDQIVRDIKKFFLAIFNVKFMTTFFINNFSSLTYILLTSEEVSYL